MRVRINWLSFEQKVRILVLRESKKTFREIEKILSIPKSTVHDNLAHISHDIKSMDNVQNVNSHKLLVFMVLVLTMEAKCSSRGIEAILNLAWGHSVSHQTILKILFYSGIVAKELNSETDLSNISNLLADEIHQKNIPILGVCDPFSATLMLGNYGDRKGESWEAFLEELKPQNLNPLSVTSDAGSGILKGVKASFCSAILIRDIFHVLYKLSKALRSMLGICLNLINRKDKAPASNKADLGKTTELAIEIFDRFENALNSLSSNWRLGNRDIDYINSAKLGKTIDTICVELSSFIKNVSSSDAIKKALTYLENGKDEILAYKRRLEESVKIEFSKYGYDNLVLNTLMNLVESIDMYHRCYEDKKGKDFYANKIVCLRKNLRDYKTACQNEVDNAINQCWDIARSLCPSSSLIECVNSVIRQHLNTYKSIPSWFTDLFTFFWNHRIFVRGKRTGHAPVELLYGKKMKDSWVDSIVDAFPYEKLRSFLPPVPSYPHSVFDAA